MLFLLCMRITGVELFYGQLFAAYAIGRLLTAVGVTPGGLGVTESATAAALVAWVRILRMPRPRWWCSRSTRT